MNQRFTLNALGLALFVAFPGWVLPAMAAEPYPALPPALSTSVTPNVMLYLDTSGSMLQDSNNNWMRLDLCDSNANWSSCVNNNTLYRTTIDDEILSPTTKMNIAKRVARNLVNNNSSLRFGLFSFDDRKTDIGGTERGEGGVLRADIKDMSNALNKTALLTAIGGIYGRTSTPLGEGLLELTQYFSGKGSLYGKRTGNYTSPIQYRCQRNFAIVVTDGDASNEDNLPGSGKVALPYTARDNNGAAVAKNFSVCTAANANASDDLSVNCPAGLEKADGSFTAAQGFGDGTNRSRAIRDVAKYARVADLRVGGVDGDGKSYDDPKFARQNLTTYTVGFGVNNDVLPAAAKVGGGKYFTATNETQLSSSLQNAIDDIVASISNAGGIATQSELSSVGNKAYQPVFNPSGWSGELRCFKINSDGSVGAACTPNAKGVIASPTTLSRKVYSAKVVSSTTTPFVFSESSTDMGNMTTMQKSLLGADTTAQQNTIKFIRGVEGIPGFRSRFNAAAGATVLMGDIVDGQPIVVSKPSGQTPDLDYAAYISANASREIVMIGANDGMLHAFNGADMTELMGYIPSAVYPRLQPLTASDYGQSAGTPHTYHVNGVLRQQDIKVGSTWKTIVVGGLGQGGQGFFAVDATSSSKFNAPATAIKWEWTDTNDASMGYSFAAPVIYNVRTSSNTVTPAVILSNGYESNWDDVATGGQKATAKDSALYIVNADTGALIKKITLPTASTGLSSPAGVDVGQDGILDYVYAGDVNGKLWRFDLTDNNPNNFKVLTTPIYDAGPGHPITMRPAVMLVNKANGDSLGNMILFGTGQLLTNSDRLDTTSQSLFGVLDKMDDSPTTVLQSDLVQQTFDTAAYTNLDNTKLAGTYRKISNNALDLTSSTNSKLGWYIGLPDASERLVTSPLVFEDKVLFGTGVTDTLEKCLPGGKGWVIGLNPLTGSVTRKGNKTSGKEYSFVDIKLDGKSTVADKIAFPSGDAYVSAYQKDGIPTELSYVATSANLFKPVNSNTDWGDKGGVIALREANSMAVYTGNQKFGGNIKTGNPFKRPVPTCDGSLYSGTVGSDTLDKARVLCPAVDAARVETTTWREIKQ